MPWGPFVSVVTKIWSNPDLTQVLLTIGQDGERLASLPHDHLAARGRGSLRRGA